MKSYRKVFTFKTTTKRALTNITREISDALNESGIMEGLLLCNSMHVTSKISLCDDSEFATDFERITSLIDSEVENADTILKHTMMGREVVIAITEGKLDIGPEEKIIYSEIDGAKDKHVLIKIIGE